MEFSMADEEMTTLQVSVKARDAFKKVAEAHGRSMTKEFDQIVQREFSKLRPQPVQVSSEWQKEDCS
jgi:hypothetical protein